MKVGYARVSSVGQSLDVQEALLREAGCEKIFSEKLSGKTTAGRAALAAALDHVRENDTLIVTRLDRLARSSADLHGIVSTLNSKGVAFTCLQQGAVDTTTSMGKLVLGVLGAVAEFENDIRRERQKDGIEKAKADGVYKGRAPKIVGAEIKALDAGGLGVTAIAKRLKIGRSSVYRALKDAG